MIRQSDQPMTFSGRSGPRGRTTNIYSACLLGLAVVSWIERNASNTAYVKLRNAVTCGHLQRAMLNMKLAVRLSCANEPELSPACLSHLRVSAI